MGVAASQTEGHHPRQDSDGAHAAPTPSGPPQGVTPQQFDEAGKVLRDSLGDLSDDIAVHGSRGAGTARPDSDIDIAIRVDPEQYETLTHERFPNPNPGTVKEKSLDYALKEGKLNGGDAKIRAVRKQLEGILGRKVDLSVIKKGGNFDQGPYIQFPKK